MKRYKALSLFIFTLRLCCLLGAVAVFQGCVQKQQTSVVLPGKRIMLQTGGPNHEKFEAAEFEWVFSSVKIRDILELDGELTWKDAFTIGFSQLQRFKLWIYFFDAQGRVLKRQVVLRSPYMKSFQRLALKKRLMVPSAAVGMAFGYQGSALTDGRTGDVWDFWYYPYQ